MYRLENNSVGSTLLPLQGLLEMELGSPGLRSYNPLMAVVFHLHYEHLECRGSGLNL